MAAPIHFAQVVADCEHAARLGGFYAELLDRPLADDANEYFAVIPASTEPPFPSLMFLQVPEPRSGKNRLHIDLATADKDAAVARAIALGAHHVGDFDEYGAVWTTLTDPEGNLFDVAMHAEQEPPAAQTPS